ncbi:MAG: CapA family protein [Tannerella sp.]|nr:CapA family protein [Tannerella sp.]
MKKKILVSISILLIITVVLIALPSNYHIRQALLHLTPEIDHFTIFENRVVAADNPKAWRQADDYNKVALPDKYLSDFDKYGTVAFVVIRNGELLFEQYWDDYSPESHSNSFSMAKSVVSLATGCAIDDGFINGIDQPVGDFFPQFSGYNNKPLTIRHLLTMSAGMDFDEAYSSLFSSTTELYYGNDLSKITFNMKEIAEPGKEFVYQSAVTQLLAYIVEKATGENICSYVSRRIWTPIEAEEDALWSLDRTDGMEKAFCCFNTNARDFARLGQLLLNKGTWGDKRIVSEQYVNEALMPDTTLIDADTGQPNRSYGFQFWSLVKNGQTIPYLRGILGQYIFVLPEENAVIVRLGHKRSSKYTADGNYPADIDIWLDAAMSILDAVPRKARLVFGGDLMQHMSQINAARDTNGEYDYTESFRYVKPLFEEADLAVINFETTLTETEKYSGYPMFRSPVSVAGMLKNIGIDVVALANNHIFDAGAKGVKTTVKVLDSLNIKHAGVFTDSIDYIKNNPLYLNVNGIRIALLNYTYSTNGLSKPAGVYVNMLDSLNIAKDIALIDRSKIDAVILFLHWGNEYQRYPSEEQKSLAALCHRYGAELVIGSHPHVIQPIRLAEDSTAITVYSLGNLVSNQRWRYSDGGLIITLDITKTSSKPLKINYKNNYIWVQTPKYRILPSEVADTIQMTDIQRTEYKRFIEDSKQIVISK